MLYSFGLCRWLTSYNASDGESRDPQRRVAASSELMLVWINRHYYLIGRYWKVYGDLITSPSFLWHLLLSRCITIILVKNDSHKSLKKLLYLWVWQSFPLSPTFFKQALWLGDVSAKQRFPLCINLGLASFVSTSMLSADELKEKPRLYVLELTGLQYRKQEAAQDFTDTKEVCRALGYREV